MALIKNLYKKHVGIFILFIILSGCSNDFLDEPKNTAGLPENIVFSDKTTVQSFESGIYARYKGQWGNPDTGGLYAMYFARSLKGKDLIQKPDWFAEDYDYKDRYATDSRPYFTWAFNYEIINYANIMITGCENNPNLDSSTKKEFIAVAKAIRAFHYFELALEFAPNYNNNKSVKRLPIYTTPTNGDREGNPPSPLSDVFALILSDLKDAIQDLPEERYSKDSPEERLGKSYMRKSVANGILARVLIVTQDDWAAAAAAAKAAYTSDGDDANSAVVSTNWDGGFDDLEDQEWLWGHYQSNIETNYYYMSPHVMMDHIKDTYKATYVSTHFRDEFSDTDKRKLFEDIYNSSTLYRKYITTKFTFSFGCDVPLMRKSEMVLIDAEAQYHLNNEDGARDLLFALQVKRDPNAIKSSNTGQALLNEILLERRKELYGELGVEWFDAKRYETSIKREANHRIPITIDTNSKLFYLQIPQAEIDANPFIDNTINIEP